MELLAVGENSDGVFFENSRTTFATISDGSSNTVLVGERSGELNLTGFTGSSGEEFFNSSWIGIVEGSLHTGWRVVGWTGEPPNNLPTSEVHFHGYAQFNSNHPGTTNFSFCDGSTHGISDGVDFEVFRALGSTNGGEVVGEY